MSRIQNYFNAIADKIACESAIAGTAGHKPDIGSNRERIVENFLAKHLPRRLRASIGGQVISHSGTESKQIDIIVSSDIGVRFEENDRTFITTESVAATISVKSYLDKAALFDSLDNLMSVPPPSAELLSFKLLKPGSFEEFSMRHPSSYVFAFDGVEVQTCMDHLKTYYTDHPAIPHNRYPKGVIVNKKYMILFSRFPVTTKSGKVVEANSFYPMPIADHLSGYPYVGMLNHVSSYVDWLGQMDVSIHPYFNFGYSLSDQIQ